MNKESKLKKIDNLEKRIFDKFKSDLWTLDNNTSVHGLKRIDLKSKIIDPITGKQLISTEAGISYSKTKLEITLNLYDPFITKRGLGALTLTYEGQNVLTKLYLILQKLDLTKITSYKDKFILKSIGYYPSSEIWSLKEDFKFLSNLKSHFKSDKELKINYILPFFCGNNQKIIKKSIDEYQWPGDLLIRDLILKKNKLKKDNKFIQTITYNPSWIDNDILRGNYQISNFVPNAETLLVSIKKRKKTSQTDVLLILDSLAFIHQNFDNSKSLKGKINLLTYLNQRLSPYTSRLANKLRNLFSKGIYPIINNLAIQPPSLNNDAHPENYLTDGCSIWRVDIEDKGIVPVQFDLVNLLEYGDDYFTSKEKDSYIDFYLKAYNSYANKTKSLINKKEFKLGYINSVIYRSLIFFSAWSSPNRKGFYSKRYNMLDKAEKSIERLKEEYNLYYTQFREEYLNLKEYINKLKIML